MFHFEARHLGGFSRKHAGTLFKTRFNEFCFLFERGKKVLFANGCHELHFLSKSLGKITLSLGLKRSTTSRQNREEDPLN